MPDDFARTQAQIAATCVLPAATVRAVAAVVEVHGPEHLAGCLHEALDHARARALSHERTGMIPRDPIDPTPDNLRNLED